MRERFEAIAKLEGLDVERHKKHGFYLCRSTHIAWKVFQAAILDV